ncbi:MAG: AAA family ATPase [Bacteroidales bacterium]|nr:AAA family ATPase [Bacteroidales bacterium]
MVEINLLFDQSMRLIGGVDLTHKRYLYSQIDWTDRLIIIKGAKGVGKTTMLLQHIRENFKDFSKVLYVSLDHIWFSKYSLMELAEFFYTHGGEYLFLDEVHKYPTWIQEVKNIYDYYPKLHLVVTGSSILNLSRNKVADLSRRHIMYVLRGLSFREYLELEGIAKFPIFSLGQILSEHISLAMDITSQIKVLPAFEAYIRHGYYPFYRENVENFDTRLQQVVTTVIETEIPLVGNLEIESVYKAKRLLGCLAQQTPYILNISDLCKKLEVSRNNLLKLLDLMNQATLIRRLYAKDGEIKALAKPEKVLFDNTNLMYALAANFDSGTMGETFFASQMSTLGTIIMPQEGDLSLPDGTTFEAGGPGKKHTQVKDITKSYVVRDGVEMGFANKIPLWLFGMLY